MMNETHKPYYAVIFSSRHSDNIDGYAEMSEKMEALAKEQPGYLGFESARSDIGITVSYWKDLPSISNWKKNFEHKIAQQKGRADWYSWYKVRVCKVEREYEFNAS